MARQHDSEGYITAKRNALSWAIHNNETRYVIELDEGDGRRFTQCGEDYLHGPEYDAFEGLVYATVYPDGEVSAE